MGSQCSGEERKASVQGGGVRGAGGSGEAEPQTSEEGFCVGEQSLLGVRV